MTEDKGASQSRGGGLQRSWRILAGLTNRSDWLLLIGLFVTQGIVVWTVQQARWINPQPQLIVTLMVAMIVALVLAKSRLSPPAAHLLALATGVLVVFLQVILLFPDAGLAAKTADMVNNVRSWWRTLEFGEPSPGTVHIAIFFAYLAWIIGYFSAWNLIKKRSPWVAIALSTITILITLHYQGHDKYYLFILFLLAALSLLALVNFLKHNSQAVNYRQWRFGRRWVYWVSIALCIVLVTVFFSWNAPQLRISRVEAFARDNNPWREQLNLIWQDFFAPVPGTTPGLAHGGQYNLQFGGSLKLSDQVIFIVHTDQAQYWQTQVYDYYNTNGWKISPTQSINVPKGDINQTPPVSQNYDKFSYTIEPQVNTNVLLIPGQLVSGDLTITKKDLIPESFTINMIDSSGDKSLPPDIRALALRLRSLNLNRFRSERFISSWMPAGIKLVSVDRQNNLLRSITVSRTGSNVQDTVALSSLIPMVKQKTYQITADVPVEPTSDQLMAAGNGYPVNITDRYLQLPANFPSRVSDLATSLTSNLNNAYAKALAIQYYLSKIPYSLDIQAPPPGADGVEYFLFTQKSGYCVYFASAMAVMLRSVGVPARMVVGFAPGQYDKQEQRFLIRDRDYHAWTQVYFPDYGWVTFDPTPSASTDLAAGSSSGAGSNNPYDQYYYFDPGLYQPPAVGVTAPPPQQGSYVGYIISPIAVFILLMIFLAWFWLYRRPGSNSSLYPRMVVLASAAGLRPRSSQTVLEFADQLSQALPERAPDITSITSVYLDVRYGKRSLDSAYRSDLTEAWRRIRYTLLKRIFHKK